MYAVRTVMAMINYYKNTGSFWVADDSHDALGEGNVSVVCFLDDRTDQEVNLSTFLCYLRDSAVGNVFICYA